MLLKRKLLLVVLGVLIAWAILFGVDYHRFSVNKSPLFSIQTIESGEVTTYLGLGYKIVDMGRNVTEMTTMFGKQMNITFTEDAIKVIQEFVTEGYAKADNAESFVSIRIYGHSFISDDMLEVYIWVLEETFFPQQGKIVLENGSSRPCLVTVNITNGGFTVIGKQFPRDGSLYPQDMKGMFPAWIRLRLNNIHRSGEITRLSQEIRSKARQHFYPLEFGD